MCTEGMRLLHSSGEAKQPLVTASKPVFTFPSFQPTISAIWISGSKNTSQTSKYAGMSWWTCIFHPFANVSTQLYFVPLEFDFVLNHFHHSV